MADRHVSRPRVLMVIGSLNIGGAERLLVDLIAHSDREQLEFMVCSLSGGALEHELSHLGVDTVRVPCRGNLDPAGAAAVLRVFRARRPDIVHTHLHPHSTLYWVPTLARLAKARAVIAHLHATADYHQRTGWRQVVRAWLDGADRRHYDRLIAISESVARSYRGPRAGVPRVETLPSGVDLQRFARRTAPMRQRARHALCLTERSLLIGTVGSLYSAKGHRYLIAAATQVVAAVPESRFLFVGAGPERALLERQVSDVGLTGLVIFTGARSDIAELLNCMDIFVLPSLSEGFGLAVCEAMACELPVVATSVGGLPEVVADGSTGLLAPPSDPDALAEAIIRLARDVDLRTQMGRAGRARVKDRFDIRVTAQRLQQIYRDVLS